MSHLTHAVRPSRPLDEAAMTELELYIDNDFTLYHRRTQPIEKNLYLKMVKGTYSSAAAPKLWAYLIEDGAKSYAREFGSAQEARRRGARDPWNELFPKPERDALAVLFARRFERQVEAGDYRHLHRTLPKKYQRTPWPEGVHDWSQPYEGSVEHADRIRKHRGSR